MPAASREGMRPAIRSFPERSAAAYFTLTFVLSWTGALAVAAPYLLRGEAIPKFTGLMMFPVMLLGPAIAGVGLTWRSAGREGIRLLLGRMVRVRVWWRWYVVLLVPPALVFATLSCAAVMWPAFAPNHFYVGATFGVVAGFFEEIGWTGYAFPALRRRFQALPAALVLGALWAVWHLPVVDYLGAATPHGEWWLPYFLAFAAAMMAMRVLICWVYSNTGSVWMAQLLHASSTGALVVLSPAVSPAQECGWFGAYAVGLCLVAAVILRKAGPWPEAMRAGEER